MIYLFIELQYFNKSNSELIQKIKQIVSLEKNKEYFGEIDTLIDNLAYGYIVLFHKMPVGFISISISNELAILIKSEWQHLEIGTNALLKMMEMNPIRANYYIDSNNNAALLLEKKIRAKL